MKSSLIITTVVALFLGTSAFSQSSISTPKADHPNLVRVSYPNKAEYVHPAKLADWLIKEPLTGEVAQGQIIHCTYKDTTFAVTATSVTYAKPDPLPSPTMSPWFAAADGSSICFAVFKDHKPEIGFSQKPKQVMSVAHGKSATIRGTVFSTKSMDVVAVDIVGDLLIAHDKQLLERFRGAFDNSVSEFRLRLARAPELPFAFMKIEPEFLPHIWGLSGSGVWQEDHPVGILIAIAQLGNDTGGSTSYAIIEMLKPALEKSYIAPPATEQAATTAKPE